ALGEDSVPVSYADVEIADCFFVTGANPAWCHPILWRRVEAHKAAHPEIKIIVADPRRTDSCAFADLHLQLRPGTDTTLHYAIGRQLIENGDLHPDFITNHTQGFESYRTRVFEKTIEEAAAICGLEAADIRKAASWIGEAKAYLSMWTMGLNQSATGVTKVLSLIDLHLLTGQIGKPGAGPFSLTGQPNAMGGREAGLLANQLPGYRAVDDAGHRAELERYWKQPAGSIRPKMGLTAV